MSTGTLKPGKTVSLTDAIAKTPQREKSGSRAYDRFDFQTAWGLSHLLRLHDSGLDYAVAFEFHDDIFVVDNATSPQKVHFFQLKTRAEGRWTIARLTNVEETETGSKASIAGKMYDNKVRFGDKVEYLGFVSNQPCNFLDEEQYPCSFATAKKEDFDEFIRKLKLEYPDVTEDDGSLFHYVKSDFTLAGYENALLGQVVNFIDNHCGPISCNSKSFYLSLMDQCRRRSKYLRDVTNLEELLAAKFITRAQMGRWLEELKVQAESRPTWSDILHDLGSVDLPEKRMLKEQWSRYTTACLSTSNAAHLRLRGVIRRLLNAGPLPAGATLIEIADALLPDVSSAAAKIPIIENEAYFRAAIMYEYYSV